MSSFRVPVGGIFGSIYYDVEDSFRVYDYNTHVNKYADMNKLLGQGCRLSSWKENDNLTLVRGTNSIEAAQQYDGFFEASMTVEFDFIRNIDWMSAVVGSDVNVVYDGNNIPIKKEFLSTGIPKTLVFVVYIQNDPTNSSSGDAFILSGVIVENLTITVDNGKSVKGSMDLVYAYSQPLDVDNIPPQNPSSEEVFNFGQSNIYFWNPGMYGTGPASFDALETYVDKFTITISHGGELIKSIASRTALNRFYKYLDYKVGATVYFKDKSRFREKFLGCASGPTNANVAPFGKILVVVENSRNCGENYGRIEFDFTNAGINDISTSITEEDAIKEEMNIFPRNLITRAWTGGNPEPELHVAPYNIRQGEVAIIHGYHYPPGTTINISYGSTTGVQSVVESNCSGEFEYGVSTKTWRMGVNTVTATVPSGAVTTLSTEIYVTSATGLLPKVYTCPSHYNTVGSGDIVINGTNFVSGSSGMIGISGISSNLQTYTTTTISEGRFSVTVPWSLLNTADKILTVTVTETISGGALTASAYVYIATTTFSATPTRFYTFAGAGLKPLVRTFLYINTGGANYTQFGIATAAADGTVSFKLAYPGTMSLPAVGSGTSYYLLQNTTLSDGTGQLKASGTY